MIKVEVYRLWPPTNEIFDKKFGGSGLDSVFTKYYDIVEIEIPQSNFIFENLNNWEVNKEDIFNNVELIESMAVTEAWKQIATAEYKPVQIGLYMPSFMKMREKCLT